MNETTETPPPPKNGVQLTDEQLNAVDTIHSWMQLDSEEMPEFKLGGYAGTGKTTVIKAVMEDLNKDFSSVVCAFTGKAVNVLQRKGIHAQTAHSLMYDVEIDKDGQVTFYKKPSLEANPDLIIVDESSMLSTELYEDLKSFGKKLLFVGDPGQLEPVGDNPNLMLLPDLVLSKIHRQAEQSPIITLASNVRIGGVMNYGDSGDGSLSVRRKSFKASEACEASQVICARNKTRCDMNDGIRRFKQFTAPLVKGEKLIVLKNNRSFGVFNGMILFLEEITEEKRDYWRITAVDELGHKYPRLPIWKEPFLNPTLRDKKNIVIPKVWAGEKTFQLVHADYGYVITCHKSQGSEWDHVIVFDEWMPPQVWDMKRWRYTAITRAAKKLTYLL